MKTLEINREFALQAYLLMIYAVRYAENQLELDAKYGATPSELDEDKVRIAVAKNLLRFFKENDEALLISKPF